MNYFDFYQLPLSCQPNQDMVKQQYYANSRKFHPDRFMQAEAQEKIHALQQAAINNEAYRTLQDPLLTLAHILQLKGCMEADEKFQLPASFLMEVMELNEAISDWELGDKNPVTGAALQQQVQQLISDLQTGIAPAMQRIDEGQATDDVLLTLKEFYYKQKYLLRIKERMSIFATQD